MCGHAQQQRRRQQRRRQQRRRQQRSHQQQSEGWQRDCLGGTDLELALLAPDARARVARGPRGEAAIPGCRVAEAPASVHVPLEVRHDGARDVAAKLGRYSGIHGDGQGQGGAE